ncbi:EAL domain-containing protein [Jidongwangia harbinensis]|uniref:EAL domain-containing protein n=1 Tax=Jidongwangia harbinensis TaxID=2878561 RepID=UPI001CD98ACD|nr:EAL domain-containing protein [Jidongwangia harbinensis]MCA2217133.1 EAL domain-containing protein [Jidongwangia harbinensis]
MTIAPASANTPVLHEVIDPNSVHMVYQPVVQLNDGLVRGYEALSRFSQADFAGPSEAFAAANDAGVGVDLELFAVQQAFRRLDDMPPGAWMSANVSVEALLTPRVRDTLLAQAHRRIAIELTEHTQVSDYLALADVTEGLRAAGILIAVDDAGAGFASLSHILQLRPDIIKLDITLIRGIDTDPVRLALARALISFAKDTGAILIAEGIETSAEHDTLRSVGVELGQGYLMARPGPLPDPH